MTRVSKRRFYGPTRVIEKYPVLSGTTKEQFEEYFRFLVAIEVIIKAKVGDHRDELKEQIGKSAPDDWKSALVIFQLRRCSPLAGPERECADKSMSKLGKLALGLSPVEALALKDAPNSDSDDNFMLALGSESEEDAMPDLEDENGNVVRRGSAEKKKKKEKEKQNDSMIMVEDDMWGRRHHGMNGDGMDTIPSWGYV
ncbi:uncharacterized protein EAE97_012194 [Botrytis byssoidea]|uniref:Uncharacterized protein n=1 Tax=Botrytis byssoidea TaxID=139641 RepID=A0A9P5HTH3_9HELO|nr:uncharacterized protein EAE97_012194 [Botrytis byssoidea]KAF7915555.1 hypothetical protein EAE97_012194 [Botrytis byssoidea]